MVQAARRRYPQRIYGSMTSDMQDHSGIYFFRIMKMIGFHQPADIGGRTGAEEATGYSEERIAAPHAINYRTGRSLGRPGVAIRNHPGHRINPMRQTAKRRRTGIGAQTRHVNTPGHRDWNSQSFTNADHAAGAGDLAVIGLHNPFDRHRASVVIKTPRDAVQRVSPLDGVKRSPGGRGWPGECRRIHRPIG